MPPKRARAAKVPAVADTIAAAKKTTKSAAAKSTAAKPAAPTAAPKTQSAKDAAAVAKANISKKRQREADDEGEDESEEESEDKENEQEVEPKAKKTKLAVAAPKVTKSKTALSKAPSSKTATTKSTSSTKKTARAKSTSNSAEHIASVPKKTAAKRKADEPVDAAPVSKKAKTAASKKAAPKKVAPPRKTVDPIQKVKVGARINLAPTAPLDIFVFGEGGAGELGLGAKVVDKKRPIDVKRPRKNLLLSAPEVGVMQIACGGMHGLALTKDNKILSWGVNDQSALGRSTVWDGGLRDADAPDSDSDSDDDDDTGLNPLESTPGEVDTSGIAPGTKFVQVAACDSASFALTEDGRVYGWGTFRVSLTPSCPSLCLASHSQPNHSLAMASLASLRP